MALWEDWRALDKIERGGGSAQRATSVPCWPFAEKEAQQERTGRVLDPRETFRPSLLKASSNRRRRRRTRRRRGIQRPCCRHHQHEEKFFVTFYCLLISRHTHSHLPPSLIPAHFTSRAISASQRSVRVTAISCTDKRFRLAEGLGMGGGARWICNYRVHAAHNTRATFLENHCALLHPVGLTYKAHKTGLSLSNNSICM